MNRPLLNPAARIAQLLKNSKTWAEVKRVVRLCPQHEAEAWQLLTEIEKERIKELKQPSNKLTPEIGVGEQVFVIAGTYRIQGTGVVECIRGVGTLQMLEVRMPNKKIQVVSIADIKKQA